MKLRAPAVPLITIDPFFNVWSMSDTLNGDCTRHWSGTPQPITGTVLVDGILYCFMGQAQNAGLMEQKEIEIDVFSTSYRMEKDGVCVRATFTSPVLLDDLKRLARPVSYLHIEVTKNNIPVMADISLSAGWEICARNPQPEEMDFDTVSAGCLSGGKIGRKDQRPLYESGDEIPIDWGWFYLVASHADALREETGIRLRVQASEMLALFGYDDVFAIEYFGKKLPGYWHRESPDIRDILLAAYEEYYLVLKKCKAFSKELIAKAQKSGGQEYAELITLAYRQVVAAHKLVCDENGDILFLSKECYSGGFAATADVSYPSTPLFLLYCPELINGMMRPVFHYAQSEAWPYPFAPHDAGQYPLVNGQKYSNGTDPEGQMPVEECGNMLIMTAAVAVCSKKLSFAEKQWETLGQWCCYLQEQGMDPQNQLCTDDFAGHLAHNCNLSVKAIMGIASFAILCRMRGMEKDAAYWMEIARSMAKTWERTAANGGGTYRLAFDQPGTFSMKYNMLWDVLFGTGLFDKDMINSEFSSYVSRHLNRYGMPLDNRADYTKSDWILWCASVLENPAFFQKMVHPVWLCYHESPSRVPLTDWYDSKTAERVGFQNRTVQGGLFIKILKDSKALDASIQK